MVLYVSKVYSCPTEEQTSVLAYNGKSELLLRIRIVYLLLFACLRLLEFLYNMYSYFVFSYLYDI